MGRVEERISHLNVLKKDRIVGTSWFRQYAQ